MSSGRASPSNSYYTGDIFDSPRRTGTDSSHYSCSNLPDDNPARYIRADEARRQIAEAPPKRPRIPALTSPRGKLAHYPAHFRNDEKLGPLKAQSPWNEYPILPTGSWDPKSGKSGAGAARGIYSKGPAADRTKFDVVYHDPTKHTAESGYSNDFSFASYRPARS